MPPVGYGQPMTGDPYRHYPGSAYYAPPTATASGRGGYYTAAPPSGLPWAATTGPYGDDGTVDYGVPCGPYPVLGQADPSQMGLPYSYARSSSRGPAPSSAMYVEAEASYYAAAAAGGGPAAGLGGRHGSESSGFGMAGFAAALPSNGDRLLPTPITPVSRTSLSSSAGVAVPSSYRQDGLPANNGYGVGKSAAAAAGTGATSPTSPISDGYGSAVDSPMSSYRHGSGSHHRPSYASSSSEGYGVGSVSSGQGESIFSDADRSNCSQGAPVDLHHFTYGGHRGSTAGNGQHQHHSEYTPTVPSSVVAGATTSPSPSSSGYAVPEVAHADVHRATVGSRRR